MVMIDDSIEIEKNQCTVMGTVRTVHGSHKNKRSPTEIRMRKMIHKTFMKYCALAGMTGGEFYEKAGILYMDVNPVGNINIMVEFPVEKRRSSKDKISSLVCMRELSKLIPILCDNHNSEKEHHENLLEKLESACVKYEKIKNPTEELEELMSEALSYLGD